MNIIKNRKEKNLKTNSAASAIEYVIVNIICLFVFMAFGYVSIMSFLQTSKIDRTAYSNEKILYIGDSIILNIFFTALFLFFIFKVRKYYDFFAKVNLRFMEIGLVVYTMILGLVWIWSVTSIPAADSYNIFEAATGAANGDYTAFLDGTDFYNKDFYNGLSYFNFYPFQLGFVFICELIYRVFGTDSSMPVQVINVLCVAAAYLGIAKISYLLFKKRSVEFIAILLLAVCFQPILFCTFVYGNIIGMCCAVWASCFLIKYFQTNKYLYLIYCGLLLVLATLAKYNNMIYLIAFVIMLIIHTIKTRKWQSIAFAAAICIATVGASNLIIMSYENRAGTVYPSGVSQPLYIDMGMQESYMAPGWYTRTGLDNYLRNNLDNEIAEQQAWSSIENRLKTFGNDPEYALDFFSKKILSQWNEPTYESIWVSKVKSHENEINFIGKNMYEKSLGQLMELHFNFYMQLILVLFAAGIYLMFLRKKTNVETVLLPLVLLGGFGYHMLFEGKSQYVLTYIILFIPYAAYTLSEMLGGKYTKLKELINKINYIPQQAEKPEE